ncbi:MAG: GGDEF domain-containing protein [Acholeplasmatales bacterium]|jgi:GGDEF domain-containing protein/PAS domain-containing protein|nr:GGDEF domain-containing protein [Acholeplasmatales bacterium]
MIYTLPTIVSIITLTLLIFYILYEKKSLQKIYLFIIQFIFFLSSILVNTLLFEEIEVRDLLLFFILGFDLLFFLTSIYLTNRRNEYIYSLFVNSIKNSKTNIYILINKNNRVKDISDSFVSEFGLKKKEIVGKKYFDIIKKTIRITKYNGISSDNDDYQKIFYSLVSDLEKNKEVNEEISFQNYNGDTIILSLLTQPTFFLKKYFGRLIIGEKHDSVFLLDLERKIKDLEFENEGLNEKLIAIFESSNDGIYSKDLTQNTIWLNNNLKNTLKINDDIISNSDFKKRIFPEDYSTLEQKISITTKSEPFFSSKYRFLVDGQYIWMVEKGKVLYEDPTGSFIIGNINIINSQGHNEKTDNSFLDNLSNKIDLHVFIKKLIENNRYFNLLLLDISSISTINENKGREIGNIILEQTIKNCCTMLVANEQFIFRYYGPIFALIMTDSRKTQLFESTSTEKKNSLDMNISIGSENIFVPIFAGICGIDNASNTPELIIKHALEALKLAKTGDYNNKICYYKNIK